eukprot:CAMPEP_0176086578 /NCGR_PEP_ID=MMETSP0120_2-20121206/43338_1 /TAXON_ID=160619 /ORGANISM="Kryptoperidinium foliaceum, Strain CCMP 1326" /LENGTH=79 /DNA_ID=CAMNT_0017420409 /DNA_START=30 /DNA_END=265 /DNA_ORIENTATION=-
MSLLFAPIDAFVSLTKSSYAFCASSSERMASASMALASLMICWIMLVTPPLAAFFLYASKPAGGGGPTGSCLFCINAAA